jgi:hypothetical protein
MKINKNSKFPETTILARTITHIQNVTAILSMLQLKLL